MRQNKARISVGAILSFSLLCTGGLAAPPVNVALKAAFPAAPYLVELLETAAEENSTAYFPLLDRIAEGHFDVAKTDQALHEAFVRTLKDDGHITDPEALSSFEFALALHSASPRIQAHHQYYNTAVEPSIANASRENCETWAYFNGQQYCSPDLTASTGQNVDKQTRSRLPFDRVLGDSTGRTPSILYADLTTPSFRQFHQTISVTAKAGKTSYRVRYKPSESQEQKPLYISGYGVELALKRTDYIVIDDRAAEDEAHKGSEHGKDPTLNDQEVADLRPLSSSELAKLDLKAASFVMNSEDPFKTLLRLSQDFPKHSAAIASTNVSQSLLSELITNRGVFLPPGYNIVWINGVQILARDFDGFAMLEHLRRERKLINSAKELGLTGEGAIKFLSHPAISESQGEQEPQRYDWRDEIEGGNVIMWLNDIETDKRYLDWPESVQALLQRTFPGQLPAVKRNIHHVILPVDFSNYDDVSLVVENIQNFVKRAVPIKFGLVPRTDSVHGAAQAKVVYHLKEIYGLSAALAYLERSLVDQGRKLAAPVQATFDLAVKDRRLRRDKDAIPLQEILAADGLGANLETAKSYLKRLGAVGHTPPFIANGVAVPRGDDWMQTMSNRVGMDSRMIQQNIYQDILGETDDLAAFFLKDASPRRNSLIIPEDEKSINFCALASIDDLKEGRIGMIPGLPASEGTIETELVHLVVIADFDTRKGYKLFTEALQFHKEHDNVELYFVHRQELSSVRQGFAHELFNTIKDRDTLDSHALVALAFTEATGDGELSPSTVEASQKFWASADAVLTAADLSRTEQQSGDGAVILNGRIVGPLKSDDTLDKDDLETLLSYERKKRLLPAAIAVKELGLAEKTTTPLGFAKMSNLIALSTSSDIPEGIFEAPPSARTSIFEKLETKHTVIEAGDITTATIQIVATIDPASEQTQRWLPILKVLSELDGVYTQIILNPRDRLDELPVKRFYRHILQSRPTFDANGKREELEARFQGLPANALLNIGLDMPPAWLVSPIDSVYDLDNLRLSSINTDVVDATYQLDHILIEGHSRDVTLGPPPRGAQLVLSTPRDPHFSDTIVMSNLGYFQFKANPGFYNLSLQKGRSDEIFEIDSAGALGYSAHAGDGSTEIALTSFRGATLFPRLSRKPGMDEEDVLEASKSTMESLAEKAGDMLSQIGLDNKPGSWLSKATKIGTSILSGTSHTSTDVATIPHADINIFSVASGHLYERMLNIMMVSVMKHTSHTVKFWFIEQFLSPSFKAFLPTLAEAYGFRYEMITYKWPHWLRAQKEKQREIWGYKILFLDVLFPLDLDKVIFVDADQIVRTDMYELVQHNLHGAPYGFTPMCDSRTEMEGFRFWKQGYWKNFLRGLPYHISALYVVDLVRFRQIAAGDRLRQTYQQLSADPQSLSNLDQDLPNHMQHALPIHSLPQEWLWCETWCSDESLGVARTIDLCNNPQTKEPKLERARRQVPEWTAYDQEIAALARQKGVDAAKGRPVATPGDAGEQARMQEEEAVEHRESRKGEQGRKRDEL